MKLMLAAKVTKPEALRFPLLASPKIDGVRAVVLGGTVYSRNMKPIPNAHVQRLFGREELEGLDGELVVGEPYGPDVFRRTTSGVMSRDGEPDVTFWVFDQIANRPFEARYDGLRQRIGNLPTRQRDLVRRVLHLLQPHAAALQEFEEKCLAQGYEGVMLRDPDGPYKHGRSTEREGYLLKLKRFEDAEAAVHGWEELMENLNPATRNAAGKLERSSAKAGKRGKGVLGALHVCCLSTGQEFAIGTGFTDEERASLWAMREKLEGKIVRYRYFPTGAKDKPRFPIFAGFRDPIDL